MNRPLQGQIVKDAGQQAADATSRTPSGAERRRHLHP